ncbi:MAG: hypothetical protein KBS82_03355 [Oscillospiraceae bacterium]|nr:hypothetical protein [Candidatus Limimonas egerieequi]
MLLDGYWKKDLKSIIKQLEFWSKRPFLFSQRFAEHQINKGVLCSAVIIRKIIEDEKDVKPFFDECSESEKYLKTLFYDVPVVKYNHVGDGDLFINSKVIIEDYDTKNAEKETVHLSMVCNQLIHSYVWSLIYCYNGKRIFGFMVASDNLKEKEALFIKIDDWINVIHFVIDNAII